MSVTFSRKELQALLRSTRGGPSAHVTVNGHLLVPIEVEPSEDPLREARARGEEVKRSLAAKAGGLLTTRDVRELLGGISPAAVTKQIKTSKLLSVKERRTNRFPKIQFDEKSGELRRGLPEVLEALRASEPPGSWGQLAFLLTPNPRLKGRTPLEALDDNLDAVVSAAAHYQEHGAL